MGPKFVWKRIGLCFGLASWLVMGNLAEVSAQSDPAGFTTVINTPPMEFPSILSIRSNTQLNVFDDPDKRFEVDNGFFLGAFFSPITNVELNLFDGAINFDFIAGPGSTVNILGGRLGPSSQANSGSVVNISGGLVSNQFDANSGSEVNITGGVVGTAFNANAGSVVNLSGGTIGSQFDAFAGSVVNITGGNIGDRFDAMSGSDVTFRPIQRRLLCQEMTC